MTTPRLEALHVSKTFRSGKVLDDVDLVLQPGEIHAMVGQNGSGKSTVVKILTGYHAPDPGARIALDGQLLALPVQWRAASAAGMSVVHQDLGLINDLTVSENIGVGGYVRSGILRRIDWRRQDEVASAVLARLQIDVHPRTPVGELPAAQRAAVGIARALRHQVDGTGLMILDEATRALPKEHLEAFHDLVRRVAATGVSVLMVSHNLEEVLAVAHKVTVLRDGSVVAAGLDTRGLGEDTIARHMLGRSVEKLHASRTSIQPGTVAASIEDLVVPGHLPLSLRIAKGEVVGVTGLSGTGFEDLPHLVAGARRATSGTVRTELGTVDLRRSTVAALMRAGVAMVPERRVLEGLALDLSLRDNVSLPSFQRRGRPWFVARKWQDEVTGEYVERLKIKAHSRESLIKELSGGNQQKVLFAKWISVEPLLLVLHEPTQAVDVGARADLLLAVASAAAGGMGVLLVSTEPADLVEACDRILVLHPGHEPLELCTDVADDIVAAIYSEPTAAGGSSRA